MTEPVDFTGTPFLDTSSTTPDLNRLNARSALLLSRNSDAVEGQRVLDLASHDGRFSYACLKLGATHVTGVEGRGYLVDRAKDSMRSLGFDDDRFSFETGDLFGFLERCKVGQFDTILCFGFFYHTIKQVTLLEEICRLQPRAFLLDTTVYPQGILLHGMRTASRLGYFARRVVQKLTGRTLLTSHKDFTEKLMVFISEEHGSEANTIDPHDVAAVPTKSLLQTLFSAHGMTHHELRFDRGAVSSTRYLDDYLGGRRAAFRIEPAPAPVAAAP